MQKCGCDCIVTDRGLKIWHPHIYGLFETAYGSDDLFESGITGQDPGTLPPTMSFHLSPDSIYPYAPENPKPYTVFDMDRAY